MKRLALLALILCTWFHIAPAHAQFNGCSSFCGTSSSSVVDGPGFNNAQSSGGGAPAFQGPGDVASGAKAWWGLRAYDLAVAGTKAIRLVRASDSTQSDISTLANGKLDTATAATFCAATTCKVVTLYDQSGALSCSSSACDLTQATDANRPTYTASCIGSLPCITFAAGSMALISAASLGIVVGAQPFSLSLMAERTANFTTQMEILNDTNCTGSFFGSSASTIGIYAQTAVVTSAAPDSAFHAMQSVFNAASSTIDIDGSTTSPGNPGTSAIAATTSLEIGTGSCGALTGLVTEGGVWSGSLTGPQQTALNSNQHTFWGF